MSDVEVLPPRRTVRKSKPKAVEGAPRDLLDIAVPAPAMLDPTAPAPPTRGQPPVTRDFVRCGLAGLVLTLCTYAPLPFAKEIGFFGPILATLAYPLWGWRQGYARAAALREKFADNCYYLGFIFTQLSLVAGFLPPALMNVDISSNHVLRFFGLALGASLIGLVARTVIIQTGHTAAENADIIEGEVDALAQLVSERSRRVLSEFEALSAKLGDSYFAIGTNLDRTGKLLEQTMRRFDSAVQADIAVLEREGRSVGDATAAASAAVAGKHAEFAEKIGAASDALDRLQAGLLLQADIAGRAINDTAASLQQGLGALNGVTQLADMVRGLDDRLGGITEQVQTVGARIETAGERVATSTEAAARAAQDALDRSKSDILEKANGFGVELQSAVTSLENTLSAFRAEMDRIRE